MNKLFDPSDYKLKPYAQMKKIFEDVYALMVKNDIPFEYSDWNRAWEYSQLLLYSPPDGKRVLDVGSGKSLFPIFLNISKASEIITLDITDVQERYRLYSNQKADIGVIKGDAQKMPFRDDYFDIVYLASVIEHIPNPHLALTEISRVLGPNGIFSMTTDYVDDPRRITDWKSGKTFREKDIRDLIESAKLNGLELLDKVDLENVDLSKKENLAVKGQYTFVSLFFKKI